MDKAITEYEKLLKEDPKDARTLLKIGDIYARKGDVKQACATYQSVADQYAEQGFFQKAVAVYKQMLALDPNQKEVLEKLAEMYKLLNLTSEAVSTYEHILAIYQAADDSANVLEVLREIAQLEPRNVVSWLRYAEALSDAKRFDEAVKVYESAAAALKEEGRADDYLKVSERIAFHRPKDTALACEIAELYLDKGETRSALVKLQASFKLNPTDVRTLELLARGFQQLGQNSKTVSVYKEIARLHEEAKRAKAQEQSPKKTIGETTPLPSRASENPEAVPAIKSLLPPLPDRSIAAPASANSEPPEVSPSASPSGTPDQNCAPAPASAAPSERTETAPTSVAPETISTRYASFPTVEPISVSSVSTVPSLPPPIVSELPSAVLTSPKGAVTGPTSRFPDEIAAAQKAATSAARAAFASTTSLTTPVEEEEEEDVFFVTEDDEHVQTPEPIADNQPLASRSPSSIPASLSSISAVPSPDAEAGEIEVAPSFLSSKPSERIRVSEVPRDLKDILAEAEFYFAQRLITEAHGTVEDGLSIYPDHPALLRLLTRMEGQKSAPPQPKPEPEPAAKSAQPSPGSIRPAKTESITPVPSRRPITPPPSPSTTENHYELGIAYMEMELHDNAIKEFTAALDNRELECMAHTLIGLCYVAKGETREGLEHFNQALSAPSCNETEEIGLLYEIGNTYEILKMRNDALSSFQKVVAIDPDFRNVKQRIERLTSPETEDEDLNDLDKLFDEIILKD